MTVLIIDDNEINRKLLKTFVKNYEDVEEILLAEDGRVGMDIIEKRKDIDIILLDLYMPNLDGFGVIEELREKKINIPIIVLSTDDTKEEEILLKGINFLKKPLKQEELLEEIYETINLSKD